ncbi:hypothetical protein [Paraburkholderia aromaticivorans]|uniref:hypothetical protein n=1 Tax=Paraburkholderia aromaticivorans TaxID=2026199 RepID=UPI0014560EC7|nr:hypothetical protein [Paraburkholderia aromaticivorans]
MKVRSLAITVICFATCVGASSTLAETSAALSDNDTAAVFGSARLSSLQDIGGSAKLGGSAASMGTDALRGASGNIGVNLVVGALNAQADQIAFITTPRAEIASQQNVHAVAQITGSGTAELGAGALTYMSGNVGVNIAAGVSNAQFNGLVVH